MQRQSQGSMSRQFSPASLPPFWMLRTNLWSFDSHCFLFCYQHRAKQPPMSSPLWLTREKEVQFVAAVNSVCLLSTICPDSFFHFVALAVPILLLNAPVDYYFKPQSVGAALPLSLQRKAHAANEKSWGRQRSHTIEERVGGRKGWEGRDRVGEHSVGGRKGERQSREKKSVKAKVVGDGRSGQAKRL